MIILLISMNQMCISLTTALPTLMNSIDEVRELLLVLFTDTVRLPGIFTAGRVDHYIPHHGMY